MTRPNCLDLASCAARGPGHCRRCHMTAPRMSAARKAAWADPEVRARMSAARKRANARKAVLLAGAPDRRQ